MLKLLLRSISSQKRSLVCLKIPMILLLFTILIPSIANATVATEIESERVCENWMTMHVAVDGDWAGMSDPKISEAIELKQGDTLLARCYNIMPEGFIVVPVLKEMPPVFTYSKTSNWDNSLVDDEYGIMRMTKDMILGRARMYVELYGSLEAEQSGNGRKLFGEIHSEQWNSYSVSTSEFKAELDKKDLTKSVTYGPPLDNHMGAGGPL